MTMARHVLSLHADAHRILKGLEPADWIREPIPWLEQKRMIEGGEEPRGR